jgi:hypothetical protein
MEADLARKIATLRRCKFSQYLAIAAICALHGGYFRSQFHPPE